MIGLGVVRNDGGNYPIVLSSLGLFSNFLTPRRIHLGVGFKVRKKWVKARWTAVEMAGVGLL